MNTNFKYLFIILALLPATLWAQSDFEKANIAAENYIRALRTFDFEKAKEYCMENTFSRVDSMALAFQNLSPAEQQKQRKESKNLTYVTKNVLIVLPEESKKSYNADMRAVKVLIKRFLRKKQTDYYLLKLYKIDGRWLVHAPLPLQAEKEYYSWFKEQFHYEIERMSDCYTQYGLRDNDLELPSGLDAFGVKMYAREKFENYCDGLNLYIARVVFPEKDTISYEDRLYISDSIRVLPLKDIILGSYTESDGTINDKQLYWFDWNKNLHIRFMKGPFYDGEIPYFKEFERLYNIDTTGLVLKEEKLDIIYKPDTYVQFKNIFIEKNYKRLTSNKFLPESDWNDLSYVMEAVEMKENHQGLDLFFVHSAPRCQEPWAEGTYHGSTSLIAYKHAQPDSLCWNISLGSSNNSEGGALDYEYYFNPDSSLSVINNESICCSATGYETLFYISGERRYYFDGKTDNNYSGSRIHSDFFDTEKLAQLREYPTNPVSFYYNEKSELNLIFYIDTTQKEKPCFCFVSHNKKDIDAIALCPKGVKCKSLPKILPVVSQETEIEAIIETSYGNIELKKDGTFKRISK